jgi:hypothetical protein
MIIGIALWMVLSMYLLRGEPGLVRGLMAAVYGGLALVGLGGEILCALAPLQQKLRFLAAASFVLHTLALTGTTAHILFGSSVDRPAMTRIINSSLLIAFLTGIFLLLLCMGDISVQQGSRKSRWYYNLVLWYSVIPWGAAVMSLLINLTHPRLHEAPYWMQMVFGLAVLLALVGVALFSGAAIRLQKAISATRLPSTVPQS